MATRARRHVHKYHKVNFNGNKLWACALPDCSHYMPQHMQDMVNGKNTICWDCGAQTTMNPVNMKKDTPQCDNCRLGFTDTDETPISAVLKKQIDGDDSVPMTDTAKRIAEFLESQKK